MGDTLKLTENNIVDIISNPLKYKDMTIIIDGNNVKDGRKKYTCMACEILKCRKHLPYQVKVINKGQASELIRVWVLS